MTTLECILIIILYIVMGIVIGIKFGAANWNNDNIVLLCIGGVIFWPITFIIRVVQALFIEDWNW